MTIPGATRGRRRYVRRFDHAEAQRRYDAGETITALASEYGVTYGSVYQVVTEAGRSAALVTRERRKGGATCDECGGPMNRASRYAGYTRCHRCGMNSLITTVREDTLRCSVCKAWKPDEAFPSNRTEPHRRGRHHECTPCQTAARRAYRERHRDRENAYQREYKRRRRTPLQVATSRLNDDS